MYLFPSDAQYHLKSLCIVTWKHGCPYVALWVSVTHFCSHTFFRICLCISICIYVHLTPHINLKPPLYSYIETWLLLCSTVFVCTSHPTPWFECVHASVHVCMSTWLPMCASPPLGYLIRGETVVPRRPLSSNWRSFLLWLWKRWGVFLFALIFIVCKPLFTWCRYICL